MASETHPARWGGSGKRSVQVGSDPAPEPTPEPPSEPTPEPAPEPEPGGPLVTDAAAELAKEHGIDLATVTGTGAEGRITKDDVAALVHPTID